MRGTGFSESDPAVTGMKNKESLEAISLSCRKILKLLSGFLLLHKDQLKGEDRRISAILNLLYRMDCNILTVLMISNWSQKRNNTVFLKLPMGVLLRTVLTDSIHAMFFMTISDAEVEKELELLRMGYANSLLDRREVYKDKVRRVSPDMDDSLLDTLYYGQLEDNYLDFYDYNEEAGFWIKKLDKHGRKERGLEKLPTSTMEGKFNALQGAPSFLLLLCLRWRERLFGHTRTIIWAYANDYLGVRKRTKRQGFALKRRDYSGKTLDFPDKGGITNTDLRGVRSWRYPVYLSNPWSEKKRRG